MSDPYECIKPKEDLYNCGGCSSTGQGMDCTSATGVLGTSCTDGKCVICLIKDTCQKGFKLATNEQGAKQCVRITPRRHI
ncbi:hypothetical protein FRC07_012733 [Ceratobasidium sp. 392]|nr:hypothetical protein FRC07_012733 [Ceratobasidium sp. 392]